MNCKLEIVLRKISRFPNLENVYVGLVTFMTLFLLILVAKTVSLKTHKNENNYYNNLISLS